MDFAFTDTGKKRKEPTKNWTEKEIEEEAKKYDAKIEEAKTSAGDVEVRDAILDKA